MPKQAHILVAPLDWGLGHASRSMPLIEKLLQKGAEVMLAGSGNSLGLLTDAFPQLPYLKLPAYAVKYSHRNSQVGKIALQIPRLLQTITKEHQLLEKWVEEYSLNGIISDNRYGLWSKDIPSVFVCHQLAIRVPSIYMPFRSILYQLHLRYINRFWKCWIPDYAEAPHLSGDLSSRYTLPAHFGYIGPLSRFESMPNPQNTFSIPELNQQQPDIVAVLSGPEPQRSILEQMILHQADALNRVIWIIQGKTDQTHIRQEKLATIIPFMQAKDLDVVFKKAQLVISRPGYSSLMDYASLALSNLILIPTPGQTEQEYLSKIVKQQKWAVVSEQDRFDLSQCITQLSATSGFPTDHRLPLLDTAIDQFFKEVRSR